MPRGYLMQTISEQLPAQAHASALEFEDRTYRKVIWRILPVLLLCYMAAYLDRVNIGFAKLDMLNELQFSNTVYALGASMFFWGYFLLRCPATCCCIATARASGSPGSC